MVVAVYPDEPFAQIITAAKLTSDIKTSFPFDINVSLPEKQSAIMPVVSAIAKGQIISMDNVTDTGATGGPSRQPPVSVIWKTVLYWISIFIVSILCLFHPFGLFFSSIIDSFGALFPLGWQGDRDGLDRSKGMKQGEKTEEGVGKD